MDRRLPLRDYPRVLPERRLAARGLSPSEYQLSSVLSGDPSSSVVKLPEKDQRILDRARYPWTQVGGRFPLMQGGQPWTCARRSCPFRKLATKHPASTRHKQNGPGLDTRLFGDGFFPPVFMVCWEEPVDGFNLYSPQPEENKRVLGCAQLLWSYCPFCKAIYSCNCCD